MDAHGAPNLKTVAAFCAIRAQVVNIPNAAAATEFDLSGTREFDQRFGYRSQSFLTVPMVNHNGDVTGVLQLINKIDPVSGTAVPFTGADERLATSIASQAAVVLDNRQLINEMHALFESLVRMIAVAIDEKSPHTANHCRRIPTLTLLLADAAHACENGPLHAFRMTDIERREIEIAAWLHDCGKITTPDYILEKDTKLKALHDRINLIDARMEIAARDAEIAYLRAALSAHQTGNRELIAQASQVHEEQLRELERDRLFLHGANRGGEHLPEQSATRIDHIAHTLYVTICGQTQPVISNDEREHLKISRGTLTANERQVMNNHIVATIKMLETLPFPKHLRNVPEFAGGHHERIDGKGFPKGLTGKQMSIPARMMAIADIFEALTSSDRPYKSPMKLSEALRILGQLKINGHIDPDLFELFVEHGVFLQYAQAFLPQEQIDVHSPHDIPGYPFVRHPTSPVGAI
jgi:HD-GYP domain-containing protein (c-di-GMP phosphodiesterase class II)